MKPLILVIFATAVSLACENDDSDEEDRPECGTRDLSVHKFIQDYHDAFEKKDRECHPGLPDRDLWEGYTDKEILVSFCRGREPAHDFVNKSLADICLEYIDNGECPWGPEPEGCDQARECICEE